LETTTTTIFTSIIQVLAGIPIQKLKDYVGATFYCLYALSDDN